MRDLLCLFLSLALFSGCMPEPRSASSQDGNPSYQVRKALESGDTDGALAIWKELADKGDSSAMVNIGMLYLEGDHLSEDFAEANKWFQLSATAGNKVGQYQLGVSLAEGRGGAVDESRAIKLLENAAAQGEVDAQLRDAKMLFDEESENFAPEKGLEFARLAANVNNAEANFLVASAYESGLGVEPDIQSARNWHFRAAQQDFVPSQLWLGKFYKAETESRNLETSLLWLQRAAQTGSDEAGTLIAEVEDELLINPSEIKQMNDVWHDNELKFDSLYIGRTFRGSMPFFNVTEMFLQDGIYKVEFGDNIMVGDIYCKVSDRQSLSQIAAWSKGQKIQIRGQIAEHEGLTIRLSRCTIS